VTGRGRKALPRGSEARPGVPPAHLPAGARQCQPWPLSDMRLTLCTQLGRLCFSHRKGIWWEGVWREMLRDSWSWATSPCALLLQEAMKATDRVGPTLKACEDSCQCSGDAHQVLHMQPVFSLHSCT
jgi:hypothetical protein